MKTLVLLLLPTLICALPVSGETRTITLTVDSRNVAEGLVTNQIAIVLGETAELVTFPPLVQGYVEVTKSNISFSISPDTFQRSKPILVAGPCFLRLRTELSGQTSFCTFRITPESFPPDKTTIVLPGTNQVAVTMECSTNLVNWTTATNGTYGSPTEAKFFRIKADKLN